MLSRLLKPVLNLSVDDFPRLAKQQFGDLPEMDAAWPHFEPPSHAILDNFWATLDNPKLPDVIELVEANPPKDRGVAYEGAAMALTLLDFVLPYKRRLKALLDGPCGPYRPMVYVGAGMILPFIPLNPYKLIGRFNDDARWFILDGYGFLQCFFHARDCLDRQARPDGLHGEAARNFDSGIGRSLYFLSAANPDRIATVLSRFPEPRRSDLWGGIGLACGYTGGALDHAGFRQMLSVSGDHASDVAVGLAVAACFRDQTNHPADHTDGACDVFWGRKSAEVAKLVTRDRIRPYPGPSGPDYEPWRQHVKSIWTAQHHTNEAAARGQT
ncbi:DUF1702 family protein [Kribbella sp. CA-294648]|uniref:DUF1702 family protein n=1 Tax=Kribbella sp. CA-294648 TaxID=3239948 RepID=UPI003D8B7811